MIKSDGILVRDSFNILNKNEPKNGNIFAYGYLQQILYMYSIIIKNLVHMLF